MHCYVIIFKKYVYNVIISFNRMNFYFFFATKIFNIRKTLKKSNKSQYLKIKLEGMLDNYDEYALFLGFFILI